VLVGPRHVLTAAHNLYRPDGTGPTEVHVVPARNLGARPVGRFRAVAHSVSAAFLRSPRAGSRFDIAMVVLGADVSAAVPEGTRGSLGHWGSPDLGASTRLRGLEPGFLSGKPVTVCGYPGDRCGADALDLRVGCDRDRQATAPMWHHGLASFTAGKPGLLLHTADTRQGQSGSPVWMRFSDGTRYLVGIHVDAHRVHDARTGRLLPATANTAVHLSTEVVAVVRSWMPDVTTGG
jgi:V8-like Glu-specific endopeptidase